MTKNYILTILVFIASIAASNAQLSGTKTIPGTYSSIALAVADLNAQGVGAGGVTFNVAAGYTETLTGRINVTATGTAGNPIVFQKSGAGANPKLTAYVGINTPTSAERDGMFSLSGSDFVTIDGIDLAESAANTTVITQMEYGFGLFKNSGTDGCQNNTIQNCVVTLDRLDNTTWTGTGHNGSCAIVMLNCTALINTTITVTDPLGSNSNNKFYSNTVQNCNAGFVLLGYAAASPFTLGDTNNDVGGSSAATGNSILNFGGGTGATNPATGVFANQQWSLNISRNNINSNNGSGVNHINILRGIFWNSSSTSANGTISNNTIALTCGGTTTANYGIDMEAGSTSASNTITISNNTIQNITDPSATTGALYCIYYVSTATNINITGNTINNITHTGTGLFAGIYNAGTATNVTLSNNTLSNINILSTGTLYGFYNASTMTTYMVNGNLINNILRSGTSGTTYGMYVGSPTNGTFNANTIDGISWTNVTSTGTTYGIYDISSGVNINYLNNIVRNFSTPTTGTLYGIREFGVSGLKVIRNNQIYNFSTTPGGAGGTSFTGISLLTGSTDSIYNNQVYALNSTGTTGGTGGTIIGILASSGTTNFVFKNKVYNLSSTSTGCTLYGMQFSGGTTNNVYNNTVGDLRLPFVNAAINLAGIYFSGGTTDNAYYNTVYLNASSAGALFGSAALYASTTPTLLLQDNIFVNNSAAKGAGFTSAYRRSSSTLTTYSNSSNNNLFFAGGSGCTSNVIYYDGTTAQQTLANYQALVTPRDAASVTEDPKFASTNGSTSNYLHINPAISTPIESGGIPVAGITADYDGDIRNVTTPDIGADEFLGTTVSACSGTPVAGTATATPNPLCSGFSTTICLTGQTAASGISVQWRSSLVNGGPYTDISCANSNCFNTGALTPGVYYYVAVVTCNNSGLTAQSNQVTVTVNPSPTVIITPASPTICGGVPTTLTASGGASYTWSTGAITPAITVTPLATTTYSVTASDAIGCTGTASATVNVIPAPIVTTSATPATICVGGNSQLQANVGFTAAQYGFSAGTGTTLDPMTGSTQVIGVSDDDTPTAAPVNIGFTFNYEGVSYTQYSVSPDGWILLGGATAVSQFTNAVTSTTNVPKIYPYWDDLATGIDGNVQVLVTGSAPNRIFIVQWFVTVPRNTTGNANSTFQAWLYETSNKIEFRYGTMGVPTSGTISGGITGLTSTNYNSITYSNNTSSSTTPNDVNAIAPPLGTIYTYLPPNYTYSWSPATFLNSTTISNPLASNVTVTTTYTVTVTNTVTGCSSTSSVTVTADPPANITGNTSICFGQSTTLTASGGTSYAWSTGANTPSITVSPPTSTTYTVTVTNSVTGCTAAVSRLVTVNPLPVITLTPSADVTICSGSSQTITATGGGTYLWSNGATTPSITVSPVVTTTYTVTVTTSAGCTGTASRTVNVIPGITLSETHVEPTTCASSDGSINLTVNSGVGPFTYNWVTPDGSGLVNGIEDQAALTVGTYFVTVTSSNGCTKTLSVTLNGPGNCGLCPSMTGPFTTSGSPNVCAGSNMTVSITGLSNMGGTYGIIFKYYPSAVADPYTALGGTDWATVPNASLTSLGTVATATAAAPVSGSYVFYAILTPTPINSTCRPSSNLNLTVNPNPSTNAVTNQTYCVGSTVPSIVFTSPTPGASFAWTRTAEAIGAPLSGSGPVPSFVTTNGGTSPLTSTFTVTASYTAGGVTCFGTPITFTITVNPNATVNTVANQAYCVGSTVPSIVFTTPTTGGTIVYNWTRTAGAIGLAPTSGVGAVPSFVATNAGTTPLSSTFSVNASITNNGVTCTGPTMQFTITINPTPQVNPQVNITTCHNTLTGPINFTTTVPGTVFNWTNSDATIGLGASGTGNIPQFTAINTGPGTKVATIMVTPTFTNGGVTCTGTKITFTITITPPPVASCKNATIYLNGSGIATLLPSDVNNGSTGGTVTLSKTTFNCSNVGPNVVTLTVTDACGKTATCTSIVTVVDNLPPVINGTIAPIVKVECDQTIPAAPTVTATDNCSATLTFTETSNQSPWLQLCEHYTYQITRLWVAKDPSGNTTTKQQIVQVGDSKAPIMTMIPVNNLYANCDESEAHGCPIPIDNCDQTPSLLFEFHYEPYLGLDGCTNSYTVFRKWTAGDKCGNTTVVTQTVYVVDHENPELTCPANIEITSSKPIAVTWKAPKAHDNCDGDLVAKQIAGPKNGSEFDPGTTTKITYVTEDNCGNTDTCSFTITIVKGIIISQGAKISGTIKNMNGGLIENAEVDIKGDVNQFTNSVAGAYAFANITKGSTEDISVSKITNPLEGVNTLDLVYITNHILGKKALNSPYKLLAADVNNNGSITTADLVELRKLILHITDKFANVESWEFLPTTTVFTNPANPWKNPIVSQVHVDNIQADQTANFDGIKMGDVTWDAVGNASGKVEVKTNDNYALKAENKEYRTGETVELSVSGKDLEGMKGLQFTIEYNPASLEYVGIKGIREDIGEENFGMRYMESGKITGSIDLKSEKGGEEMFKMVFKAKENGSLLNSIKMTSSVTRAEAYTKSDETNGVSLSFTQYGKEIAITTAVLYQNEPNPFENSTMIRFDMPESQEATLSIYNVDGKIVKELSGVYEKGEHQVNLSKEEFPASGVYYYQLKTNNFNETKKMMFIR